MQQKSAEVGRGKTDILNFLKKPERYGTIKSYGRLKKIITRRIQLAFWQDTVCFEEWSLKFWSADEQTDSF